MTNRLALMRLRQAEGDDADWARALRAGKSRATALALWCFMLGFLLDDLHLVRLPMLYVGLALALVAYALGPPWLAGRILARALADRPQAHGYALESSVAWGRLALGVTIAVFVAWLSLFAAGRTPRW